VHDGEKKRDDLDRRGVSAELGVEMLDGEGATTSWAMRSSR
jgi:hypothetical protein